ncbi:hypothetical protein DFH06DRAFT_1422721 [Mycena polygramma]|nr:hypothetical protein DFH06DRAFT_1422721 [Mycena polygramma]
MYLALCSSPRGGQAWTSGPATDSASTKSNNAIDMARGNLADRPLKTKYSLQTTTPSLNHPKLVYGFVIGVFCLCVAAVLWVKEGHTSFATSIVALVLALTTVNLGVLNVVVLLPRLGQAETKQVLSVNLAINLAALVAALHLVVVSLPRIRPTKQVLHHVHGLGTLVGYDGFPHRSQEDLFVTVVLVLAGQIQLLIQATTFCPAALALLDAEHSAVEPVQFVPGMDDGKASLLQAIFVVLAVLAIDSAMILSNVVLCVLLMLASAYPNVQNVLLDILIRRQSWCSSTDLHDDDANATLVDDTPDSAKDMQPVCADTLRSPSPPSPPAHISASKPATGVTSASVDLLSLHISPRQIRADAPAFIPTSANLALDPAPSTVDEHAAPSELSTCAPESRFDPSAPAFIPFRRPTSAPLALNVALASTEDAKKKKDWQPTRALSFQWARGGCPIRIAAPPAPTPLNGSAPHIVLKPRAASAPVIPIVGEDAHRPGLTEAVEAKTEDDKKEWQPTRALSFRWSRGGCPTRITAPAASTPLNGSAPEFVPPPRAAASVIPIVDEDAHRPGLSESMWATCMTPAVEIKNRIVFRRAPPSFWSRGRCAIPIVPPSTA